LRCLIPALFGALVWREEREVTTLAGMSLIGGQAGNVDPGRGTGAGRRVHYYAKESALSCLKYGVIALDEALFNRKFLGS